MGMCRLKVVCKSISLPSFFWGGGKGGIFEVILAVNTNVTECWNVTQWGFVVGANTAGEYAVSFFRVEYLKMGAGISSET